MNANQILEIIHIKLWEITIRNPYIDSFNATDNIYELYDLTEDYLNMKYDWGTDKQQLKRIKNILIGFIREEKINNILNG